MIEKAAPISRTDLNSEHQTEEPIKREPNEHGEVYFTQSLLRVMQETLTGQRIHNSEQTNNTVYSFDEAYDRMKADSAVRQAILKK